MAHSTKAHKRRGYSAADKRAIQAHIDALLRMGCIVCGSWMRSCLQIHHIRQGLGMGQRGSDLYTLPLCFNHHQSEFAGSISIHGKPALFKARFGEELDLLIRALDRLYPNRIYPAEYTERVIDELNSYRESL